MSMAISAVILTASFHCFGYGFTLTQLLRENQRATQIIMEKVEILRLYNWDQVNTAGFIPTEFTDVYDPQAVDGQGITYQGKLQLLDFPTSANAPAYRTNLKQLVITLNWTTAGKIGHTRKLATVIAKNGEQNYVY